MRHWFNTATFADGAHFDSATFTDGARFGEVACVGDAVMKRVRDS